MRNFEGAALQLLLLLLRLWDVYVNCGFSGSGVEGIKQSAGVTFEIGAQNPVHATRLLR